MSRSGPAQAAGHASALSCANLFPLPALVTWVLCCDLAESWLYLPAKCGEWLLTVHSMSGLIRILDNML